MMFSGNAADLLKSMGAAVPETKEQTPLEQAQAAKASQPAEACHDPDCGHDHSHASHGHAHGHAEHNHGHKRELNPFFSLARQHPFRNSREFRIEFIRTATLSGRRREGCLERASA